MVNRTPTGFTRKQPPMTPPGYTRITDGPNVGKIRPDSHPSTPAGFVRAKPEYFTFDKNVKPQTPEGQGQSQMTPRTMVSNIVEKLGEKFTIRPRTPEFSSSLDSGVRDQKRQDANYSREREQSQNRYDNRSRSDFYDNYGRMPTWQQNNDAMWGNVPYAPRSYPREQSYQNYSRSQSPYRQQYFDNNPFRTKWQLPYRQNPYGYQNYPTDADQYCQRDSFWRPENNYFTPDRPL